MSRVCGGLEEGVSRGYVGTRQAPGLEARVVVVWNFRGPQTPWTLGRCGCGGLLFGVWQACRVAARLMTTHVLMTISII